MFVWLLSKFPTVLRALRPGRWIAARCHRRCRGVGGFTVTVTAGFSHSVRFDVVRMSYVLSRSSGTHTRRQAARIYCRCERARGAVRCSGRWFLSQGAVSGVRVCVVPACVCVCVCKLSDTRHTRRKCHRNARNLTQFPPNALCDRLYPAYSAYKDSKIYQGFQCLMHDDFT